MKINKICLIFLCFLKILYIPLRSQLNEELNLKPYTHMIQKYRHMDFGLFGLDQEMTEGLFDENESLEM